MITAGLKCNPRSPRTVIGILNTTSPAQKGTAYDSDNFATVAMPAQGWHRDHATDKLLRWRKKGEPTPCFIVIATEEEGADLDVVPRSHIPGQSFDIQADMRTIHIPQGHVLIVDGALIHRGSKAMKSNVRVHIFAKNRQLNQRNADSIASTDIDMLPVCSIQYSDD